MPTRIYAVKDERTHGVYRGQERELCSVNLTPPAPFQPGGPFVVLATGELRGLEVSFIVRLSIFRFGGALLASDEYSFWRGPNDVIQSSTLAISLAVELPGESGGSSGPELPPQPRAALAVDAINDNGYGTASKLRIAATQFDELHETSIPAPPMPLDSAAEVFFRMRGPGTLGDPAE